MAEELKFPDNFKWVESKLLCFQRVLQKIVPIFWTTKPRAFAGTAKECLNFPKDFFWGSSTSSYQVEGGIENNDWAQAACAGRVPVAGQACDSYNRYKEDFDIAKSLGQNAHRFSIEWARIEPEEGRFDEGAIEHYRKVLRALRDRGIEPMVTLWHFTNPIWFSKKGGWVSSRSPEYFTRYVKYVVAHLKDGVGLWITFNEAASVWAGFSYLNGQWPPQHKNLFEYQRVRKNFIKAHTLAYQEIKKIYDVPRPIQNPTLGMSHNVEVGLVESNVFSAQGDYWYEKIIGKIYNYQRNLYFWDKTFPYYDFIGLNYYHVDRRVPGNYRILPRQGWMPEMNWETYPKGIYHRLMELKKFKKPIYITENGVADGTDKLRAKFIKDHLRWVWQAIHDGADVRGYFYWSLLDNFEWAKGFEPRFGLVEIDYDSMERRIRPSAYEYKKICESNSLRS